MKYKSFIRFLFILLFCILLSHAEAQCAMCKSVVETGKNNGSTAALGLNNAIFYLLGIPVLAVATVSFAFWRRWKATQK